MVTFTKDKRKAKTTRIGRKYKGGFWAVGSVLLLEQGVRYTMCLICEDLLSCALMINVLL